MGLDDKINEVKAKVEKEIDEIKVDIETQIAEAKATVDYLVDQVGDYKDELQEEVEEKISWIKKNRKLLLIGAGLVLGGMILAAILTSIGPTLF
jgi:hypothetical protein